MRRVLVGLVALALTLPIAGLVAAAGPDKSIRLVDSPGFVSTSEETTPSGAVIETFVSADTTVRVIARPGSSATLREVSDPESGQTTLSVEMTTTRAKSLADADSYRKSGRSAVKDLIALGVPAADAQREFGDMDVMDPRASVQVASATTSTSEVIALAVTPSTSVPYDTQCASVSTGGGEITGWGCSTLYLIAAANGDWWFNNKYKFSAHSTEPASVGCLLTGLGCPWRLTRVGWSLAWAVNNIVYDWDPASTMNKSSCSSTEIAATYHGFGISVKTDICPDKLDVWNLTSRRSGSMWYGIEHSTDTEAAIGLQALHSPPNAAATYTSPLNLVFIHFPS